MRLRLNLPTNEGNVKVSLRKEPTSKQTLAFPLLYHVITGDPDEALIYSYKVKTENKHKTILPFLRCFFRLIYLLRLKPLFFLSGIHGA